jgi:hypothetical protein
MRTKCGMAPTPGTCCQRHWLPNPRLLLNPWLLPNTNIKYLRVVHYHQVMWLCGCLETHSQQNDVVDYMEIEIKTCRRC